MDQIRHIHFPALARPTVQNRLGKLKRAGLIAPRRIGTVLYQNRPKIIGVVYQVTRRGLGILQEGALESIRDEPMRINTAALSHDLLLTDVLRALAIRFSDRKAMHGRLIPMTNVCNMRVPDAVILGENGSPAVAIELELTAKSDRRYREIISQYRISPVYPKVLYIVGRDEIAAKIKSKIIGHKIDPTRLCPSTGKFYFVRLDALLSQPGTVQITNGNIELVA